MRRQTVNLAGDGVQQAGQPSIALARHEIHQHPFPDINLRSGDDLFGPTDADAHPPVIRAKMTVDVADAVMPAMPATTFDPDTAGGQIDLVIEHKDVGWRNFVESGDLGHRPAGFVHEGLRFDSDHLLGADPAFRDQACPLCFPSGKTMPFGHGVDRHETDIMPVAGIVRTGVA